MNKDCSVSIKIDKITKVINKLDYFMFRAMEKNNVDTFRMVEIIKNPEANKADLEKLVNTSRQLIDEQIVKYNKQAASALKKGDSELAESYNTFSSNLQNITANWKQATSNLLQYSDSFKMRTKFKLDQEGMVDLSDLADDEDAMYKKFVVDQSANEIDPFDNIDKATELFLRSIPKKGEDFDEYGFNLNVNYGSFVNNLLADLENTMDIDEIIEKLEKNVGKVPEYQSIIDKLQNDNNFIDTQSNINFRNAFAKAQITIFTTSVEDNVIKVFEATKARRSMYQKQIESNFYLRGMPVMINGAEVNLAHKDGQTWVVDSSDAQKIKDIFDKSVLDKVSAEESGNRRVALLKAVGFDFSPQTEKILKLSGNKVQFEYIYKHLINRLTVPSNNKSYGPVDKTDVITNPISALKKDWNATRTGQNSVLNNIIELEIKYNPVYSIQRSIINNEGNQQFSTQNHNNFTVVNKFLSDYEKYKTLQDIITAQPSMEWLDAKTNPSIRSDLFMRSLFDFDINSDTYGERKRVKYKNGKYEYTTNQEEGVPVQIKINNTGGVQSKDEGNFKVDGSSTTGLEEADKLLQDLNTFKLGGFSSVLRLSDKSTDLAISLNFYIDPITGEPKQRPLESVGNYSNIFTSEVFLASMMNGVKDIARMKFLGHRGYYDDLNFSSKSIKNTWGMFDSIIPKEIKELLDTIIASEGITTEEMAADLIDDPDTALLLKNAVTDYFKKYSKEFLGKLAPVKDIIQKNDYLIGKGNDKFVPDYEGNINYYLASKFIMDMSNLKIFFGDTIFFKDFTKRASKDSATGIFTFVEDRLITKLNDRNNTQGIGVNTNLSARMFAERLYQQGKISLEQRNEMLSKQEISKDKEFKSAVFKDVEFNSLQIGKIINNVKALYEAKEISEESYKLFVNEIKTVIEKKYNGEEGDGQGKCTFDFYRTISILTNNWTKQQELSYKKIIEYNHYDELAIDEKDENKKAEYLSKRDAVGYNPAEQVHFPPKKFQYAGPMKHDVMLKTNGNMYNSFVPMFDKFSLYPLIPTVIKGTTDEELSKRMQFEGLGYIKFKSASKVEVPKNMDEYYEGHDKNNPDERTTIPFEKRLKTNTTKFNSEHTIFFNHLKEQVRIDSETHDHVIFGSQPRKLILMNMLSSNSVHNKAEFTRLADEYKTSMDALIKIEKTLLYNQLGISNKSGQVTIDDMRKMVKYFRDQVDRKNQDSNVRKALNFDEKTGDFEIPLDAAVQAQILEGIVISSINNNIVRYKASGSMLTQVAVTGTEAINFSKEDSARAFNKYGNQGLKYYNVIDKNGKKVVTEMQVKLGFTKQWLPLLNLTHTDNTTIGSLERLNECLKDETWVEQNKKSIRMIAYRIPTGGRNFLDVMLVAEFLPSHFGDAIIMPTEAIIKSGSDFDIDKMFCFYPNLNENGTHSHTTYTQEDLDNPKIAAQLKSSIQNDIFQTMSEVILHPNNYMELVTPSFNYHLMPMVDKIYTKLGKLDSNGKRTTTDYKNTDVLNQCRNIEKFGSLLNGKNDLGIAAIANTFNVLYQLSGAKGNPEFFKKKVIKTFFESKFMTKAGNNVIQSLSYDDIYDEDGILKSEFFTEFINAFVDVAKDDYVFGMNVVTEFSPMIFYMKNSGLSSKKILAFINQPILRSYIKNLSKYQNIFVKNYLESEVDETQKRLATEFTPEQLLEAEESPSDSTNPRIFELQSKLREIKAGARTKALSETLKEYGFNEVPNNRESIGMELRSKGDINYSDKFTSQGLFNNIQKEKGFKASNLTAEQKDFQLAIMYEMLNLKEQSDSMTNAQRFLNFDTNPYASAFDVYSRNASYQKAISSDKKNIGNNVLSPETLMKIKKQSIISGLDVSEEIKTLLETLLPVRNNQELNERILGKVINMKENNRNKTIKSDDDMLRYARTYKNDLMTYILQNHIGDSVKGMEFFKSEFATDKSFNDYLKELIDTSKMTEALNKIRNASYYAEMLESFPILGRITIQPGQNTKNLITYSFVESGSNPLEKQSIITQFEDIIQKKDAEIAPVVAFFKDLALYSVFQSGYNTSDNSYTSMTPVSLINKLYSYGIKEFSEVDDKIAEYKEFEKLFGKNNPNFYNDRRTTDTITGEISKKGKWYSKDVGLSLNKKEVKVKSEKTMSTGNKFKMKSYIVDKIKNGTKVTASRAFFIKDGVYEITNDEGNNLMVELKLYKEKFSATNLTTPEMQNAYAIAEGYNSWLDLEENIMEGRTQTLTQDFLSGNQSVYVYRVKPLQAKQATQASISIKEFDIADKLTPIEQNFADGSGGRAMQPQFKDKSTMDLIISGDRTRTTRAKTDIQRMAKDYSLSKISDLVGKVIRMTDNKGIQVYTRITKVAPFTQEYQDATWQKEGWVKSVTDKHVGDYPYAIEFEVVNKPTQTTTNPLVAAGIKSTDMNGNAAKDIQMASESTQFIGFGTIMKEGNVSSTDKYAKAWGTRANTGNYTANDVVMISGSGNFGRGGVDKTEEAQAIRNTLNQKYKSLIEKAIAARASFRVGNQYSKGNLSDELVAKYLQQKGYKEEKLTGYSRWIAPSDTQSLVVKNILKEYTLEELKQGVNLRSLQDKVLKGNEETIKTAYNYLKAREKVELLKKEYDDTVEKNKEITRKINSLTERINNTIPTKVGDVLDISNNENVSDYKAKLLEITRNEKGAVLKIITAKKKEYTLVVTKEGKTKTGYVTNFVFESSKEDVGTLKVDKENLKSQLVSVKDYFDYDGAFSKTWKDYFTTTQPSTSIEPKGEKVKEGIYVNQGALTKEEQLELFDYLKPFLESQGKKTNMGDNAPIMIGLGLRWDYKRNNPSRTPVNVGANLAGGQTSYAYYDLSIDGKPLGKITPRFVELMNKTTGVDISNYDGAIINIYSNGSFIGNHSDLEESATAEKYPVVVANIGGSGNIILGTGKDQTKVDLKPGAGYLFGVGGKNRKIAHSTYASEVKGFLPSISISQEGKTFNEGGYRVSITMRRVMPLEQGMPSKPGIKAEIVKENIIKSTNEVTSDDIIINNFRNELVWNIETSNAGLVGMHNEYNQTKLESEQTTLDEFLKMMSCLGKLK